MEKKEALRRWQNLEPDQAILPHFTPIAADARGSTFGACGIRISGNPEFIDAVLSRLKDLLAAEAGSTRLNLSRQPVKPVSITNGETVTNKSWMNADTDAETCYIQIRERTAKTRQRKVREHTNPLPNLGDAQQRELIPPIQKDESRKPYEPPEGAIHTNGGAIYNDDAKDDSRPDNGFFVVQDERDDENEG